VEIDCNFSGLHISADAVILTRRIFHELCGPEIEQFRECIGHLRDFARGQCFAFGDALLLGGSCKIPALQAEIVRLFPGEPFKLDLAVVHGAALWSAERDHSKTGTI
jgi:molecular chaperone DnaK (HSP70)